MFLSGLDNIDFRGFGSMGGDMSESDLFSTFRSALPLSKPGKLFGSNDMPDSLLHSIISAVLGQYEIRKIQIPASDAAQIKTAVRFIIVGVAPVVGPAYADEISAVVESLKSSGYSLVPIGYVAPNAIPVKSELVDPNNIAAAGALVVGRTGSPASPAGPASPASQTSSAPSGSIAETISSGIQSIIAAWPKRAPAGPTQYIRAPHIQTAAEKQRLILIMGGFGLLFVLAIGIVAVRNND